LTVKTKSELDYLNLFQKSRSPVRRQSISGKNCTCLGQLLNVSLYWKSWFFPPRSDWHCIIYLNKADKSTLGWTGSLQKKKCSIDHLD